MAFHSSTPCAWSRAQAEKRYARYEAALARFEDAHRAFALEMLGVGLLAKRLPGDCVPQEPCEVVQGFVECTSENTEICIDYDVLVELRAVAAVNREAA